MDELYKLRDMMCEELEKYGQKNDMTAGSLDVVDKLTHAIKNLDKIIESYEDDGYSEGMMPRYYYDGEGGMSREGRGGNRGGGRSYRGGSYADGRSYARGRGQNARRDSMGRYSRDGMADKLRDLMEDAPDDRTKDEIQKLAERIERM